jgi:glycosyltransferase involved in cell wall biosynthesis
VKLYYLCPDYGTHAGGVRVIYRHVDLLRRNGYDAFVVHERRGFRDTTFENETPVLAWSAQSHRRHRSFASRSIRSIRRSLGRVPPSGTLHVREPPRFEIEPSDVLVIPEVLGPNLTAIAPGVPKVIFAQNGYVVFHGYPADPRAVVPPYRHADVVATLAISDDTRQLIDYTFPGTRSYRVRWSLNPAHYRFEENKLRQITYMPRKGAEDGKQVLNTLVSRGSLDGYRIRPIESLDEAGVAACLRESLVFLSLGHHEGLPLPPAEAMACGAIVVGYDGFGGREYLRPEFSFPVSAGNLLEFAQTLERVLALQEQSPDELRDRARRAAAFVAENYSPAREEEELLAVWDEIVTALGNPGRA